MPATAKWYHAHVDNISRSSGRTAVGVIAYITGEKLKDEETGKWCVRNHPGGVTAWGSVAPGTSLAYLTDPDKLGRAWNDVQKSEVRVNSELCRHWNTGSSREFSPQDHMEVAEEIAGRISDRFKIVVTWSVHEPTEHGDPDNWHLHFVHNMREVGEEGFGKKVRELSAYEHSTAELYWFRKTIADVLNERLEKIGSNERVDHRSYAARGIDQEPMQHLGDKQNQDELTGKRTRVGDHNRDVRARNVELNQLKAEQAEVTAQIFNLEAERQKREEQKKMSDTIYVDRQGNAGHDHELGMGTENEPERVKAHIRELGKAAEREERDERIRVSAREAVQEWNLKAEEAKANDAARAKEDEERRSKGQINSAENRWQEAIANSGFNYRDPVGSMMRAVEKQHEIFTTQQDKIKQAYLEEKDPLKREALGLRMEAEQYRYLAFTHKQTADMSRVTTRSNSISAQRDDLRRDYYTAVADKIEDEMKGLQNGKTNDLTGLRERIDTLKDKAGEWYEKKVNQIEPPRHARHFGHIAQQQGARAHPHNQTAEQKAEVAKGVRAAETSADNDEPDQAGRGLREAARAKAVLDEVERRRHDGQASQAGHTNQQAANVNGDQGQNQTAAKDAEVNARTEGADINADGSAEQRHATSRARRSMTPDERAAEAYNKNCSDQGIEPNDKDRAAWIREWGNLDEDNRIAGLEAAINRGDIPNGQGIWVDKDGEWQGWEDKWAAEVAQRQRDDQASEAALAVDQPAKTQGQGQTTDKPLNPILERALGMIDKDKAAEIKSESGKENGGNDRGGNGRGGGKGKGGAER